MDQESPEIQEQVAGALIASPNWLRLAYGAEYLIALPALLYVWAQVGGQGHLDLLPWHIKLGSIALLAWCWVRFTAAMAEQPKAWNRRSIAWLLRILLVGAWMGSLIYYYHLHEVLGDPDAEESTATSVSNLRLVKTADAA